MCINVSYLSLAETEDDVINISTVIDYSRVVFNRWRMRHFTVAVQEVHTAGICLGQAQRGRTTDDCIKKQIFPSEISGWSDQVF